MIYDNKNKQLYYSKKRIKNHRKKSQIINFFCETLSLLS